MIPTPGTPEAQTLGCTCPAENVGRIGYYWVSRYCPLHGDTDPSKSDEPLVPSQQVKITDLAAMSEPAKRQLYREMQQAMGIVPLRDSVEDKR